MKPKHTRPPLLRMQRIHESLSAKRYPNCGKLARELEVTPKTVQRDIDYMRDQLGLPIDYDASRRGFYYTESVNALPTIQVSEGEVLALLVAGQTLAQYRGTPYEKQLKAAFDKLTAGLGDTISFNAGAGLTGISFNAVGQTETDITLFESLSRALTERRQVEFDYRKPGPQAPERRRVEPYHLAYRDNLCYLVGRDVNKDALRQFALLRITKLKVRNAHYAIPAGFSAEQYFAGAFGAQGGTEDHLVRIRFDASAAFYIRERRWHASQTLKDLADGSVELSMRLATLTEVERWVLSWGTHAEVLEPTTLAGSIISTLKQSMRTYLRE